MSKDDPNIVFTRTSQHVNKNMKVCKINKMNRTKIALIIKLPNYMFFRLPILLKRIT